MPLHDLVSEAIEACNFIKKRDFGTVYPCKFCETFKNTYFIEHLRTTAPVVLQAIEMLRFQLRFQAKKLGTLLTNSHTEKQKCEHLCLKHY